MDYPPEGGQRDPGIGGEVMRDPNEPSIMDHGAPYNEDDEGNCECFICARAARRRAKEEQEEEYHEYRTQDYRKDDRDGRGTA